MRKWLTRGEPPVLQLRVVNQHMAAAQHITQLGHLQPVPLQIGDDRRCLRSEVLSRGQQPLRYVPSRAVISIISRTLVRTTSVCSVLSAPDTGPPGRSAGATPVTTGLCRTLPVNTAEAVAHPSDAAPAPTSHTDDKTELTNSVSVKDMPVSASTYGHETQLRSKHKNQNHLPERSRGSPSNAHYRPGVEGAATAA